MTRKKITTPESQEKLKQHFMDFWGKQEEEWKMLYGFKISEFQKARADLMEHIMLYSEMQINKQVQMISWGIPYSDIYNPK